MMFVVCLIVVDQLHSQNIVQRILQAFSRTDCIQDGPIQTGSCPERWKSYQFCCSPACNLAVWLWLPLSISGQSVCKHVWKVTSASSPSARQSCLNQCVPGNHTKVSALSTSGPYRALRYLSIFPTGIENCKQPLAISSQFRHLRKPSKQACARSAMSLASRIGL